jgi:tetratricopeptide (TPR) repeat protein
MHGITKVNRYVDKESTMKLSSLWIKQQSKSLDKAIEINPQYAYAWYNRGLALFNVKPYEDDDLKHLVY